MNIDEMTIEQIRDYIEKCKGQPEDCFIAAANAWLQKKIAAKRHFTLGMSGATPEDIKLIEVVHYMDNGGKILVDSPWLGSRDEWRAVEQESPK